MTAVNVGVVRESTPERRVSVVPEMVSRLRGLGLEVLVETGAGDGAWHPDSAYAEAGATLLSGAAFDEAADVLLCVQPPDPRRLDRLRSGQLLAGLFTALTETDLVRTCVDRGVTLVSLDLLPRTLSRAQSMDALTSQANIAGYKAVLVAADAYGRYLPMLMTAAGTAKPAQVLILGAGVAGLAAMGTARRLGAQVTGYDIRPETRDEVRSVGARFLDLGGVAVADGVGGYARALTEEERIAQQQALQERIGRFDIVITTAQVPGRVPPQLVTAEALKGMRPGSVVVDIAAGPLGGNVAGSRPGQRLVVTPGVTVIGAGNLAAEMAPGASAAYARNITALVTHLVRDGRPVIDLDDEIQAAVVVTHEGRVVNPMIGGAR